LVVLAVLRDKLELEPHAEFRLVRRSQHLFADDAEADGEPRLE
jgi:hypothetical protein